TIFVIYFRDAPTDHSYVGPAELHKVEQGKIDHTAQKVPYLAIIKTPAVWAVWVAAFATVFVTQLMLQFTPIYLNKVLGFSIASTGFAAASPALAQLLIKLLAGLTSRHIDSVSELLKVRIYNTLALCGTGIFFIALAFTPASKAVLSLLLFIAAASMTGFSLGGFFRSATLMARHHSHFILGNISRLHCFAWMLVPFVVDIIAPTDSPHEWKNVFLLCAGIMIVANIFFCIFAKGQPAEWTNDVSTDMHLNTFQHRKATLVSQTSLWNVMVY
uniref:Uncharacterized protein n=1 Tax=Plectus sambesii TaxID=2011161 RepID=A0A914WME6_9BILA